MEFGTCMKKRIQISKPPETLPVDKTGQMIKIFLAGSIEMGKAVDWQTRLTNDLSKTDFNLHVLNPRRDDWDSSWEQSIDNAQFREQVEWELTGLELSDIVALYFDGDTKSPISLLELGLHVRGEKTIIYCPDEFWRKGNVDVTATFYGVPVYTDYKSWLTAILKKCLKETKRGTNGE